MTKKSFKFNPNFCLVSFKHPTHSKCMFDHWSLDHFYWQGFVYIILHHFLKLKKLKHMIIVTLSLSTIHMLEEYFGNKKKNNLENIVFKYLLPFFNPNAKKETRYDNDYLDNSIGDVLSGLISNILIILFWMKYNKLPYWYLYLASLLIMKYLIISKK